MEAEWQADRARLRELVHTRPDLLEGQMAARLGRSYSWAKKWAKRLTFSSAHDASVLCSHSRRRKTSFPAWHPRLIEKVEEIRLHPPANLRRTPGSKTILYFLARDPDLKRLGCRLPRSARTIWKLLRSLGLITYAPAHKHQEESLCAPLEEVQVDFQDATTVPPDPYGKQQHMVEICNFVDRGTSILLSAQVSDDFHAATALEAVIAFLQEHGCPPRMSFDHDPRWLGSATGRDFPSALCRMLLCLGIEPRIIPPRRPDLHGYVERYHRTYKYECLLVHQPATLADVREVTEQFAWHYNYQRPHQGRACGNRTPREAFPELPKLPPLPRLVQADRWLHQYHQRAFARTVGSDGCMSINHDPYYVSVRLAGHRVTSVVDAERSLFQIWLADQPITHLSIKGIIRARLPLQEYLERMVEEAQSEERRRLARQARWQMWGEWAP